MRKETVGFTTGTERYVAEPAVLPVRQKKYGVSENRVLASHFWKPGLTPVPQTLPEFGKCNIKTTSVQFSTFITMMVCT